MPPTETAPISTGPSRLQNIFATTLLILVIGGIGLIAQKAYTSIQFVIQGYEASPQILIGFIPWVAGALAAMFFVLFISWRVARLVYRSQSYALWTSLVLGIYASIWFLLLYVLLPNALKFASIPDWASFAAGLLLGIAMAFVNAAFVLSTILALLLSVFRWRKSTIVPRTGVLGSFLFGVLGLVLLVYASGVLIYPAKAFNLQSLCYGVMSRSEQSRCLASSFTVTESGPFDTIKATVSNPRDFRMIGGKFAFVARQGSLPALGSGQVLFVNGEPITAGKGDLAAGPVDAGNGRIAYVVASGARDSQVSSLYVDDQLIVTDKSIGLIDVPGIFAYVVYGNVRSYANENGQIVAEGKDETRAYAEAKWPLRLEWQKDIYANAERDEATGEMLYRIGAYELIQKRDGVYLDGKLLAPGLMSRPQLVDGKVIFSASGANAEGQIDTYIFAERGLIPNEVRARFVE